MKIARYVLCAAFLLAQMTFGAAIQCYICSWSPDDNNNRTDFCTDDNFQKNIVVTGNCEQGCEVFIQWDANERMEHIRRNCVDADEKLEDGCHFEPNGWWLVKRCMCTDDLCNNAELSGSEETFRASSFKTSLLTTLGLLLKLKMAGNV